MRAVAYSLFGKWHGMEENLFFHACCRESTVISTLVLSKNGTRIFF